MWQTASPSNLHLGNGPAIGIAEEDLVKRAQARDDEALGTLFDAYYPKLLSYGLLQFRDVHAAEDLASDVMLRVVESIPRYRTKGVPLSAWVFRIARNRIVDIRRRGFRRREVALGESLSAIPASASNATLERAIDSGQLSSALSQLTPVQEQVILLRFFRDLDVATVARIVGRSQSAVKSLQFRALVSLRRTLVGQESEAVTTISPAQRARDRLALA